MGKIALVTDSVSCLPPQEVRKYGIGVVPVEFIFEDRVYRDGELTSKEFYARLKEARRLPTTAAPSPASYLEAYRQAGEGGEGLLCLTVSSRLSAIYNSALTAAEMAQVAVPHLPVRVLDSQTAAMAQGFLVLEAARVAEQGKSLDEVEATARALIPRVNFLVVLDTLYYLAKGGRVPRAVAWAGDLLQMKPILEVKEGEVRLAERARTRPKALKRLLELVRERDQGKGPLHLAVMHAEAEPEAREVEALLHREFPVVESHFTEFTQVMGVHCGPGVVAVAFYQES